MHTRKWLGFTLVFILSQWRNQVFLSGGHQEATVSYLSEHGPLSAPLYIIWHVAIYPFTVSLFVLSCQTDHSCNTLEFRLQGMTNKWGKWSTKHNNKILLLLPVLVPPVMIHAFVDSATLTIPCWKILLSLGCKTKSLAPPVISMRSLGNSKPQLSLSNSKTSSAFASCDTRTYYRQIYRHISIHDIIGYFGWHCTIWNTAFQV